MITITVRMFDVPEISCDHCKRAIEQEVGALDGVAIVNVDVAAKTVRVEGSVTAEMTVEAIGTAGYDVASIR